MSNDERCGATCRDGSPCQSYPIRGANRCRMHGGQSPGGDGAPEGNSRAVTHGAYADQKKLYSQEFSERECDLADRIFEDYYGRYQSLHDAEPPLGFKLRLFNIAVNAVTEMRVENWFTDQPDELQTGTPHLDRETHVSESGTKYYRYQKSPAMAAMKSLSDYNRKWLKTFGLEPESDAPASADVEGVITILSSEVAGVDGGD